MFKYNYFEAIDLFKNRQCNFSDLDGIDFGGKSEGGDDGIKEGDKKIDTDDVDEDLKKQQQDAINKMNNNADNSSDDSDDEDEDSDDEEDNSSDDEDEDDSEDDESDDDSWLNDDDEDDEDEDDKSDSDSDDDSKDDDKNDSEDESDENKSDDEDSGDDDKKSNQDSAFSKDDNLDKLEPAVREDKAVMAIYEKNKSILPKSLIENWQKYRETGNNAFLSIDNHLHKLVMAVKKTNADLPIEERLDIGMSIAFKDELSKLEQKKGGVKAEIKNQKVNKIISNSNQSSNSNSSKKGYTSEQEKMAKAMGVKL